MLRLRMITNEVSRSVAEEVSLRLLFRKSSGRKPVLVRPIRPWRFHAVFPQVIVVVCLEEPVLLLGRTRTMEVLYAHPGIESVLQHHVVAKMPLAEVSAVVVIANQLGDSGRVCR